MIFYVCSYGGSGSKMLCNSLKRHGKVYHIHSRNPPNKLQYIGGGNTYHEWFNGVEIQGEINEYKVIYIYRNPVKAIMSRFSFPDHLEHVQTDRNTTINEVITRENDLFGISEFYSNYTTKNKDRNYKIYCVKYEDIFEKQHELSKILGVGKLSLVKKETNRINTVNGKERFEKLTEIYKNLIKQMDNNDFIHIS
jgi:hypothetical protein